MIILTIPPWTAVKSESKIDEAGFPTISLDTRGKSEYSKTPFISFSAAFFIRVFISSAEVSFSKITVRSTSEPSGVGTLTAIPSRTPFSEGITKPIAFAAPVVVGIIFTAAALALLKSL